MSAVERRKLSDQVRETLENQILRGVLNVGDQLPSERELMSKFGVGRPAVREALFSLSRKGLVQIVSGTRARVTSPTPDLLLDEISGVAQYMLEQPGGQNHFQEARAFFEVGLARFAALNASDKDLARLESALNDNRAAIGNMELFKETDIAFHFVLAEIPQNPIFPAIHHAMVAWLTDQRDTTLRVPGQAQIALRAHEEIFDTVSSGDPDRAESAMQAHLDQLFRVYGLVKESLANILADDQKPLDEQDSPESSRKR